MTDRWTRKIKDVIIVDAMRISSILGLEDNFDRKPMSGCVDSGWIRRSQVVNPLERV